MAIIGLGIVIAFVLAAQSLMQQNVGTGRRSAPTQEETAHSTPAHAWRKGEVPFLYQIDPQWSDEPYAGGNIHENGCGPTCLSMVYISPIEDPTQRREHGNPNRAGERWRSSASES